MLSGKSPTAISSYGFEDSVYSKGTLIKKNQIQMHAKGLNQIENLNNDDVLSPMKKQSKQVFSVSKTEVSLEKISPMQSQTDSVAAM